MSDLDFDTVATILEVAGAPECAHCGGIGLIFPEKALGYLADALRASGTSYAEQARVLGLDPARWSDMRAGKRPGAWANSPDAGKRSSAVVLLVRKMCASDATAAERLKTLIRERKNP